MWPTSKTALADALSDAEVAAVADFYASDLGMRLKAAELASSDPAERAAMQSRLPEYRAQLDGEPERLAVFREIDANLKVTELSASMALSVILAMAAGAIESQPQGSSPDMLAAVEERIRAMYPSLLEEMGDQILGSLAWTYRDVSVEDLTDYAAFLRSDAAKAVYAAIASTSRETLEAGSRRIGAEFGVFLRQKRT